MVSYLIVLLLMNKIKLKVVQSTLTFKALLCHMTPCRKGYFEFYITSDNSWKVLSNSGINQPLIRHMDHKRCAGYVPTRR